MMATTNSRASGGGIAERGWSADSLVRLFRNLDSGQRGDRAACALLRWLVRFAPLLILLALPQTGWTAPEPQTARIERAFFEAKARFGKNSNDLEAAWRLGQACFDWADLAGTDARRA